MPSSSCMSSFKCRVLEDHHHRHQRQRGSAQAHERSCRSAPSSSARLHPGDGYRKRASRHEHSPPPHRSTRLRGTGERSSTAGIVLPSSSTAWRPSTDAGLRCNDKEIFENSWRPRHLAGELQGGLLRRNSTASSPWSPDVTIVALCGDLHRLRPGAPRLPGQVLMFSSPLMFPPSYIIVPLLNILAGG